jgi:hypothetical protein
MVSCFTMRPILTDAAILRIRELAAETEGRWQLPKYSHAEIGKMMDCSETTVFRVIHKLGRFAVQGSQIQAVPQSDETNRAAAESLKRLLQIRQADTAAPEQEPEPSDGNSEPKVRSNP